MFLLPFGETVGAELEIFILITCPCVFLPPIAQPISFIFVSLQFNSFTNAGQLAKNLKPEFQTPGFPPVSSNQSLQYTNKEMNNGEGQRKEVCYVARTCHRKRQNQHFSPHLGYRHEILV
jgi:hypothetical protein